MRLLDGVPDRDLCVLPPSRTWGDGDRSGCFPWEQRARLKIKGREVLACVTPYSNGPFP